jgi:hypothetical protein
MGVAALVSGGSSAVFTIAGLLSNMSLRHLSPSLRTAVNNADTCTHSTYQCYGALSLTLRKPTQPAAPSVVACHLMPHVTVLPTFYTYVCTSLQDSLRAYVGTCWRPSHSPLLLGKDCNSVLHAMEILQHKDEYMQTGVEHAPPPDFEENCSRVE